MRREKRLNENEQRYLSREEGKRVKRLRRQGHALTLPEKATKARESGLVRERPRFET